MKRTYIMFTWRAAVNSSKPVRLSKAQNPSKDAYSLVEALMCCAVRLLKVLNKWRCSQVVQNTTNIKFKYIGGTSNWNSAQWQNFEKFSRLVYFGLQLAVKNLHEITTLSYHKLVRKTNMEHNLATEPVTEPEVEYSVWDHMCMRNSFDFFLLWFCFLCCSFSFQTRLSPFYLLVCICVMLTCSIKDLDNVYICIVYLGHGH